MQYTFEVTGMTCGHCERAVTQAVHAVDANANVQIDRAQNQVQILSDLPAATLQKAISDEGYPTHLKN